jgi:DNA repair exonuclease SbcCD ATPase subunit
MKFIRLRITNYRGIASSEVLFNPKGITLIQGPNETGKTSLGEAIGLLFEFPDNSKHRNVEAIRPVHRDEGPEIELQAESGDYCFTYFKRFHKKPETRLTITRPKAENLTGREAHDRAADILRETLDITLWKALTIQQGEGIQQPPLDEQTSLSTALDKAAGGRAADPRQEALFDKVRDEYLRYYTERGSERKELSDSRNALADTESEVARINQAIRDLDQDIDRAAVLQQELLRLKKQEDELTKSVESYGASLEEIAALENSLSEAKLKLESAQKSVQVTSKDKEARQKLIEVVADLEHTLKEYETNLAESLPALKLAAEELRKAEAAFNEADRKRKEADSLASLRRADFDYYNNKLHLEQLQERKDRIDEARLQAAKAEQTLAGNKVDESKLKAIQKAEREFLDADARLQAGAPNVLLRGLADCRIYIDDAEIELAKGKERAFSVPDRSRITIPGALDIEVTAGSSADSLAKNASEAQRKMESACAKAGVASLEEAQQAFEERREAIRSIDAKAQIEKDNLRDLTYEELDRRLLGLKQSVPDYPASRASQPAIAPDLDSAKKEKTNAEALQKKAQGDWEAAREAVEATRGIRDGLNEKHQEARIQLDLLTKNLKQARESLDRARNGIPDDALESALNSAIQAVALGNTNALNADQLLKAKNPEQVRHLAETAKGSLQTTQNRRNDAQTELTEVQTRLKIHGEEGLHEKLHIAETRHERLTAENRSLFRRAASAKCLFETMREQRDQARRAYVAPLKGKVESLGRLVFDSSFQVEISEDLQIVNRTLATTTVPFESLSGGTKEQLSLIFRLACSMIVAEEGGTPLLFDDALGYTDPQRLNLVGAVLAKAAKDCQIVIFTCMPDRYSNIGEATVVSLK